MTAGIAWLPCQATNQNIIQFFDLAGCGQQSSNAKGAFFTFGLRELMAKNKRLQAFNNERLLFSGAFQIYLFLAGTSF